MNILLTKSYTAEAAIPAFSIVKFGAADLGVVLAAAATDLSIGVTGELASDPGEICDVARSGLVQIKLAGTVARGGKITSNAAGLGVAAAAGNVVVAQAEKSGVAGDIIPAMLIPGTTST
jgi:hypothetical protein